MMKTTIAVVVVFLVAILAVAQSPTASSFTAIRVLTPTGWVYAQPDGSIQIDVAANPPVIRAVTARETVDRFVVVDPTQAFTMSAEVAAGAVVAVYRNGLLMAEGEDYTAAGRDVLFLPQQPVGAGDIVQLRYRRAP